MNQQDYARELHAEIDRLSGLTVGALYDSATGATGQRFRRALEDMAATLVEIRHLEEAKAEQANALSPDLQSMADGARARLVQAAAELRSPQ